jgi:membrane-bound lytic murein transglycosylase D
VTAAGTLIVPLDKADAFRANLESYDKPLVSWTTYPAKKGEAVDAIARRHGVTGAQLRAVNDSFKLDRKGRLRASQQVLVPMAPRKATVQVAQAPMATIADSAAAKDSTPIAKAGWYTVRTGDTLFGIARRANTALDKLLHLNGLTPASVLKPGFRLRLQ